MLLVHPPCLAWVADVAPGASRGGLMEPSAGFEKELLAEACWGSIPSSSPVWAAGRPHSLKGNQNRVHTSHKNI